MLGAAGAVLAHFVSRAPELARLRRIQMVCVPFVLVMGCALLPDAGAATIGDMARLPTFVLTMFVLALLIAPSIAFHCGAGFTNLIDPQNWTPANEELALNPIRKLIDRDLHREALHELERLLQTHEASYEALLLKTKLLFHFSSHHATVATLLQMIRLSQTPAQQMAVMESLHALEKEFGGVATPRTTESPKVFSLDHELILFDSVGDDPIKHEILPPGSYDVEEVMLGHVRWLKLKGSDWGNQIACWEAAKRPATTDGDPGGDLAKTSIPGQTMAQPVLAQAKARELKKRAILLIQEERWDEAVETLLGAFRCDPGNHEIAYRLMEAARRKGPGQEVQQLLKEVVKSGSWTEQELELLQHGC
jgi:hypothetical protein